MSTDWSTDLSKYDGVLYVQAAPYPQDVECLECEEAFETLIDGEMIGGENCPECGGSIRYVHDRFRLPEDEETESEQAGLGGWSE